ncbi:hypothetical protein JCM5350_002912 [Sporobolomyces pararoseus]
MAEEKPDIKPEGAKHSVTIRYKDGDDLTIKIKGHTPMKKVYAAIASNKGLAPDSFKLTYDGEVVQPEDTSSGIVLDSSYIGQ